MSASVASDLDELELDPEAPNILDTGFEELASLIGVLSRPSISVFIFDSEVLSIRRGSLG